ncbi:hypothetical protein [Jannaschia ovalis]|uniref:Uncharacterized protein n=1 Tax=Jannaschia ovalis TaxID=3038773 RepID=A0ABY8L988_9RHOB|nr:hypothetical protein [Jannaschia sp. GRR-S6-38]WGH77177.1 hypothetical protein P8627_08895 [Jannaschia sp. GRR-S6-38]
MQVAMAAPHMPRAPAPVEKRAEPVERGGGGGAPGVHPLRAGGARKLREDAAQFGQDVRDRRAAGAADHRGGRVIGGDRLARGRGQRVVERAARGDGLEFAVGREAPHPQHPVHHRPRAAQRETVALSRDRQHVAVDHRRRGGVELQLAQKQGVAPFRGAHVHVVVDHGPFELQRDRAAEEDIGAVGLDDLDRCVVGGRGIQRPKGGGRRQEGDGLGLVQWADSRLVDRSIGARRAGGP